MVEERRRGEGRREPGSGVEVVDLTVRFGDTVAVDGVSFTAEPGRITALLGPNGAGKTTTVETLEGYRTPDGGRVRVLGLDPVRDHGALMPSLGVMLQDGGVYTACRPREVLRLFASYYEHPLDPDLLLDRVGLAGRARSTWRSLSGGEQQRLSLALALVGRPTVAFLDEPTAGVDPAGRTVIRELVSELRDDGVCVLLTTHDLDDAERLADHVVIVDGGRVLASGTPEFLTGGVGDESVHFGARAGLDVAALGHAIGATVTETAAGEYRIEGAGDPQRLAALTAWLAERSETVKDIRAGRRSLEDVFLQLTDATGRGGSTG